MCTGVELGRGTGANVCERHLMARRPLMAAAFEFAVKLLLAVLGSLLFSRADSYEGQPDMGHRRVKTNCNSLAPPCSSFPAFNE